MSGPRSCRPASTSPSPARSARLDLNATATVVIDAHLDHLEPPEPPDPTASLASRDPLDHPASPELHHHQSPSPLAPARAAPTDHPAHLAQLARKDPTARRDPQEPPDTMPPPVAMDSPAHPAQLESLEPLARLERLAHLARTDPKEAREHPAQLDQPAQLDPRARRDPMAPPATVELQEDLDPLDQPAQLATQDPLAKLVNLAHLAHLERTQSTAPALAAHSSTRSRNRKGHQSSHDLVTAQLSLSTVDTLPFCMLITMVLVNSKFAIVSFVK